jgi:hypothetical protein
MAARNNPVYQLTQAGRQAWESQDTAVPEDYRRILWLMDFHGQEGILAELLRRYPKNVLDEWLVEMEDLGLIEPALGGAQSFSSREADRTQAMDHASVRRESRDAGVARARPSLI